MISFGYKRGLEPIHGYHYLIDYYAILGGDEPLPRDASPEEIEKAFKKQILLYHPDRARTLAKDIQDITKERSVLLNFAYQTLIDPEKRAAYDKKLAGFNPRTISPDGVPILEMRDRRMDIDFLVGCGVWEGKENQLEVARKKHGYSEEAFDLIVQQYRSSEKPSPELKKAYIDAIKSKITYLSVVESILWDNAGVGNQEEIGGFYLDDVYLQKRRDQIGEVKQEIPNKVEARLLSLASGESPKMLIGPEGAVDSNFAQESIEELKEKLTERAMGRFESSVPELESTASQVADLFDELSRLTEWEYYPPEQRMFRKLLLLLEHDGKIVMQHPLEFDENIENVEEIGEYNIGDSPTVEQLKSESGVKMVQDIIDSGTNVFMLHLDLDLEIGAQISDVVRTHGTTLHKLYKNTSQTEK